jgi:hypothetical protein
LICETAKPEPPGNAELPEPGYVYVLFNSALKGLVKIGRTGRDPKGRAAELSGTGLPTPFEVAYDAYFADASAVEQFIHSTLTNDGFRRASNREFFEMPISDAVKAVIAAEAIYATATPSDAPASTSVGGGGLDDICDFADALYHGRAELLADEKRAIELYRKAAAAGSTRAVLSLAEAWVSREPSVDWGELRPALQREMDAGVIEASAYMAVGMIRSNHAANTRKCWDLFFRHFATMPDRRRAVWGSRYIQFTDRDAITTTDREALQRDRDAILSHLLECDPRLKLKGEVMLGGLEALPKRRGHVARVEIDGGIMIRFGSTLVAVPAFEIASGMTLTKGQSVEFVIDPLTGLVRAVRPHK